MKEFERASLLMVRHMPVAADYRSLSYGRSDVPLDDCSQAACEPIAQQLAEWQPSIVLHSGLSRSTIFASRIAELCGGTLECCEDLRERDFGTWELQPWDAIYASSGDDMLKMLTEPATFRPGGGETTFEVRDRILRWFERLSDGCRVVAVSHGGPIAALTASLNNLPVDQWVRAIPRCGEIVGFENRNVIRQTANGPAVQAATPPSLQSALPLAEVK